MTKNKYVLSWIDEMAAMTKPDRIVYIDGSEEQTEALRREACSTQKRDCRRSNHFIFQKRH